jgi:modulator of FtsH protease
MQTAPVQLAETWKDFFVTTAGASATLVGLVIVAISVNLQRILEQPQLPSRGGAAVGALVLILVISLAELIPQPHAALAIEVSVFGLLVWLLQVLAARQIMVAYSQRRRPLHESIIGIAIGQLQAIPFIIGGISLFMRLGAGPYWIAWGMITTFILSVINTWILLVEILR